MPESEKRPNKTMDDDDANSCWRLERRLFFSIALFRSSLRAYKCFQLNMMLTESENRKSNCLNNCWCYCLCFFHFSLFPFDNFVCALCICVFFASLFSPSFLLLLCGPQKKLTINELLEFSFKSERLELRTMKFD